MSDAEVRKLLGLAMLSPTAFNIQNWRFVIVKDPALRRAVRAHAWDQEQVTDASLLVVLCADLNAWRNDPARYWAHAPQEVQDLYIPGIDKYYRQKPAVQRDEAMRSCALAAQTLMLAAKSMGYDSCPMDGFDFEAVGHLINLPRDHVITMFVAIGKATEQPWPRGSQVPFEHAVIVDRYPISQEQHSQVHGATDIQEFRPGVYRHYKGAYYLALGLARDDESNEPLVVYARLYERDGLPLSMRTLKVWNESVPVGNTFVKRFAYIGQESPRDS
jgi:nitroreductase